MYIETALQSTEAEPAYILISDNGDIVIKNENNDCCILISEGANKSQIESGTVNVLSYGNVNVESMGDILLTANGDISLNPAGKAFYIKMVKLLLYILYNVFNKTLLIM